MVSETGPRPENETDLTRQLQDLLRQASEVAGRLSSVQSGGDARKIASDLRALESRLESSVEPKLDLRVDARDAVQKPKTIEDLMHYLNDSTNEGRIEIDGIEKVVRPLGWEVIPHPHLPGLTIFLKSDAKPDAKGVVQGAMVVSKGAEYMYAHKYFEGIGSGPRVAKTLEAATMDLPAESLEDLKHGRGMFREQGVLLGFLGRKGKVMRGE